MDQKIPNWIVALLGGLCRFVIGAFGAKMPHPWPSGVCWPFWVTLIGVTVGLPIVLVAYVIKAVVKNRKARKVVGTILLSAYLGFMALLLLMALNWMLWHFGTIGMLIVIGIFIGAVGAVIGLIALIIYLADRVGKTEWYVNRQVAKRERQKQKEKERLEAGGREAKEKKPSWVGLFFRGVWAVVCTLALVVYAAYKKFCPRVEFP